MELAHHQALANKSILQPRLQRVQRTGIRSVEVRQYHQDGEQVPVRPFELLEEVQEPSAVLVNRRLDRLGVLLAAGVGQQKGVAVHREPGVRADWTATA